MKKLLTTSLFLLPIIGFAQPGSLDPSFSGDGRVVTPVGTANEQGSAVAIQSDGKIVVAGWDGEATVNNNYLVIRYNADGTLDGSFGTGGVAIVDFTGDDDRAYAIAIQPDGKILAGGSCNVGPDPSMGLIRLNTDGSLDNTFDGDGILSFDAGTTTDWISSLVVQPDGKILAAGSKSTFTTGDYLVVRFNSDGTLDTGFNGTGFTVWDIGGDDFCNAIALQSDGKILLAGTTGSTTSDTDFCLARLNSDGTQDSGFGTVVTNFSSTTEEIFALTIQSDGRIVAGGYRHNGSNYDFAALRYLTDGSLDNSFDMDGVVYYPVGTSDDVARAIAVQVDGKILLGGTKYDGPDFTVMRLNADGSLDNTFDTDGIASADFAGGFDDAFGMAMQADGKIVLTGESQNSTWDVATIRMNTAGSVEVPEYNNPGLALYPNPAKDQLLLKNSKAGTAYRICDVSGRLIAEGKCDEHSSKIDISALEPGCYLFDYMETGSHFNSVFMKQ
jgi:uncharacterized delta-60 repeat protein